MTDDLTPELAREMLAAYGQEATDFTDAILAAWEADRARLATLEADAECEIDALLGEARMGATECEHQLELAEARLATARMDRQYWIDAGKGWTERGIHNAKTIRALRAGIREAVDAIEELVHSDPAIAERLPASVLMGLESLITPPLANIEVPNDAL